MPRANTGKKLTGWKQLASVVVDEVRKYVDERCLVVEQQIAEQRGMSLADAYAGTYETSHAYERGQVVTHNGSLWLCLSATTTRPGDSGDWRLVVRKGKDGK